VTDDLTPFGIVYRARRGRWYALCSQCKPCTIHASRNWGIAFEAAFMHASQHTKAAGE
jgi:hypothetical protein